MTNTVSRLRSDLTETGQAIENLTKAIAQGGQLEPPLAELKVRQRRYEEILAVIEVNEQAAQAQLDSGHN